MLDADIIYLSNRIDSLEKNQIELLDIIKQTLSEVTNPKIQMLIKNLPKEKRSQHRKQISVPISYEFSSNHSMISHYGKSFNISESGICFYTKTPLKEGLSVLIQSEHIWDSQMTGIVRWCNRKYLNFYQVGVSFQ